MNLNRLKSTGLLIDGFDSFLASWFQIERTLVKPKYTPEIQRVLDLLPNEIQRFYEILQHWPQMGFLEGYLHHNELFAPPKIFDEDHLHVIIENQGNWDVVYAFDGENQGRFLFNNEVLYGEPRKELEKVKYEDIHRNPKYWDRIEADNDVFLVTAALYEVIRFFSNYGYEQWTREGSKAELSEQNLIFNGMHFYEEINFYYCPTTRILQYAFGGPNSGESCKPYLTYYQDRDDPGKPAIS